MDAKRLQLKKRATVGLSLRIGVVCGFRRRCGVRQRTQSTKAVESCWRMWISTQLSTTGANYTGKEDACWLPAARMKLPTGVRKGKGRVCFCAVSYLNPSGVSRCQNWHEAVRRHSGGRFIRRCCAALGKQALLSGIGECFTARITHYFIGSIGIEYPQVGMSS